VGNQKIQFFCFHISSLQSTFSSSTHNLDCKFENVLTAHMNGVFVSSCSFRSSRFTATTSRLNQEFAAATVSTKFNAKYAFTLVNNAYNSSACTVTKEHAGITVGEVHNAGQGFCANDKRFIIQTSFNHLACYCQIIYEAAATSRKVKSSCVLAAQAILHQASGRRERVVRRSSTNNYQLDFFRFNACIFHCSLSSDYRHIRGCFFGSSKVTLFDTGAFSNPLVTGINNFFHIEVSNSFFRHVMSDAQNTNSSRHLSVSSFLF